MSEEKKSEVKPGWKTTEFWLSFLAVLLGAFIAAGFFPAEHWAIKVAGLALSALTAMGYTSHRSRTKAEALKVPDWVE